MGSNQRLIGALIVVVLLLSPIRALHGQAADCIQPARVCAVRAQVYMISAFDPFASAVRIAPDLLVTNRHVIADVRIARITRKDGRVIEGRVVPTSFEGDLVLIRANGLAPFGEGLEMARDGAGKLYTVGADVMRRLVRAYPPGRRTLPIDIAPYARLHHSAYSQSGNSGGALVDGQGRLVGIVTSGGEGRFEAVPARDIARLRRLSGDRFTERHGEIGKAYRVCIETLEQLPRRGILPETIADRLVNFCRASKNRQLFDLAAQALGRGRRLKRAITMSEAAVERDANAINTRLALAINLHIAGRYREELPHIKRLLTVIPEDAGVQRLAIQAGKWAGNMALANHGLALLRQKNPAQAAAAERFLKSSGPPPQQRD